MSTSPEDEARRKFTVNRRLDYLFHFAWVSIAQERGYIYDTFMSTSSHGTIALRSYFHLLGV